MESAKGNTQALSELEREVIALFVRMAVLLSLPRSVGEIYGILFISTGPMCLDDCRHRLDISKGSTSQGLRILRSFGAIRTVGVSGDRKDYYVAETSLRKIASGFASEQIRPHVAGGKERIDRIRSLLMEEPLDPAEKTVLGEKIDLLQNWQTRAGRTLPLILKLIGS